MGADRKSSLHNRYLASHPEQESLERQSRRPDQTGWQSDTGSSTGQDSEEEFKRADKPAYMDVLCWHCSSTWELTGWCDKQHRTDHGASDGPSPQPFKIWILPMTYAGLTHSSVHGWENHPSQHVCTTSKPEDQPKEDTSDDAEFPKPLMTGNREDLLIPKEFTYLSNTIRYDGWAGSDIRNHLNKARKVFRNLNKPHKSSQYSTKTRLYGHVGLHQSCILSTLLYSSECLRMTDSGLNKLSTLHTKNLGRILWILPRDHLQPTSSRPLQPRQHTCRHHPHVKAMNRTCD